jgi:hypothetical protein
MGVEDELCFCLVICWIFGWFLLRGRIRLEFMGLYPKSTYAVLMPALIFRDLLNIVDMESYFEFLDFYHNPHALNILPALSLETLPHPNSTAQIP